MRERLKLLLDTHVFAWIASGWRDLTDMERTAIAAASDSLFVSVVSLWELRLKWRSNPRHASEERLITPTQGIALAERRAITISPLHAVVVATPLDPPLAHKDPFDDLLLVHARLLGAQLLTRDTDVINHPLAYHP